MQAEWQTGDPDQIAPLGAVWSGSALSAQTYLTENLGSLWQCVQIMQKEVPYQTAAVWSGVLLFAHAWAKNNISFVSPYATDPEKKRPYPKKYVHFRN